MAINVLFFGQLTDIVGSPSLILENIEDTQQLQQHLIERFPGLQHVTYAMAIDRQIIQSNTPVLESQTVALLPPFSGG